MATATLRTLGGSVVMTIPKPLLEQAHLRSGAQVDIQFRAAGAAAGAGHLAPGVQPARRRGVGLPDHAGRAKQPRTRLHGVVDGLRHGDAGRGVVPSAAHGGFPRAGCSLQGEGASRCGRGSTRAGAGGAGLIIPTSTAAS